MSLTTFCETVELNGCPHSEQVSLKVDMLRLASGKMSSESHHMTCHLHFTCHLHVSDLLLHHFTCHLPCTCLVTSLVISLVNTQEDLGREWRVRATPPCGRACVRPRERARLSTSYLYNKMKQHTLTADEDDVLGRLGGSEKVLELVDEFEAHNDQASRRPRRPA